MEKVTKVFGLSCLLLSIQVISPASAFSLLPKGWDLSCKADKTKDAYKQALKNNGKLNSHLKKCIQNKEKAEANPNSTGAFLKECHKHDSLPENEEGKISELKKLCKKTSLLSLKGNLFSGLTGGAGKAVKKLEKGDIIGAVSGGMSSFAKGTEDTEADSIPDEDKEASNTDQETDDDQAESSDD